MRRALLQAGAFRRGAASTLGFDLGARLLGAATVVVLIRGLPVHEYAYFVVFLAVSQMLATASTGGVRLRYLRSESERVSRGDTGPDRFRSAIVDATRILAPIALLGLGISAVTGLGAEPHPALYCLLVSSYALPQAVIELGIAHHQAHLAFRRAGAIGLVRALLLLVAVVLMTTLSFRTGFAVALSSSALLLALAVAVAAPLCVRRPSTRPLGPGTRAETGWLTVYTVASAVYANVDVLIVAALLSTADVAAFGAAQRYFSLVLGAVPALIAVLRVRTSQADLVDSFAAQRRMLVAWMRRIGPPLGALCAVLAALAPLAIPLVDSGRYPDSIPVFQALLIYALAVYVVLPAPSMLMTQKRFAALVLLILATLAANAAGDVLAASLWGIVGVAVAASTVNVVSSVVAAVAALRSPSVTVEPARRQYERTAGS